MDNSTEKQEQETQGRAPKSIVNEGKTQDKLKKKSSKNTILLSTSRQRIQYY
jgi:hypothetical protein